MSLSFDFESAQSAVATSPPSSTIAASPDELPSGGLAPWRARRVLHYIDNHLSQHLGSEFMASVAYVSRSHFCRAFKRTFGITLHRHVIRRRIERAQHLMTTTTATLSEIALMCGMSDHSHFTRLFRRLVGEAPGTWRKRNVMALAGPTTRHTAARACGGAATHRSYT